MSLNSEITNILDNEENANHFLNGNFEQVKGLENIDYMMIKETEDGFKDGIEFVYEFTKGKEKSLVLIKGYYDSYESEFDTEKWMFVEEKKVEITKYVEIEK